MRQVTFLFSALAMFSCSKSEISETMAVYGADNRTPTASSPRNVASYASSIALITRRFQVKATNQDTVTINAVNQGDVLQMCSDEPFRDELMTGDCTGFLVGVDRLVTARHCIPNQKSCDERLFIFNHVSPAQNSFPKKQVYSCKKIISAAEKDAGDLVLVELDRPLDPSLNAPFLTQEKQSAKRRPHGQLYVLGHPFGGSLTAAPLESELKPENLIYRRGYADVSQGHSGSPLFDPDTGEVHGVLTGGEKDLAWDESRSCNKTNVCKTNECKGEQFSSLQYLSFQ
jgi:V8-like Glu-specific endopeptidase